MNRYGSLFFFLLILLIFAEGIYFTQLVERTNILLKVYAYQSQYSWVSYYFLFFASKFPVIAENLAQLILAFPHLFTSLIALKLYAKWNKKQFFYLLIGSYAVFLLVSISLIFLYSTQVSFFAVWQDFTNLFFSPFLIFFTYLVIKLVRK